MPLARLKEKLAALILCTLPLPVAAEVVQSEPGAFTVRLERSVDSSNTELYAGLAELPRWWNDSHSFSGSASNLSFELRAGGCFCEQWGNGSAEHLRVVYAVPGREVRLRGGLGPLQGMTVDGLMHWRIVQTDSGSQLTWEYRVWGTPDNQLDRIAPAVDSVLAEQIDALVALVDGKPRKE